jgi:hypothetical protein
LNIVLEDFYRAVRGVVPSPIKNIGELHLWKLGYLRETGWTRSRREGAAVDRHGAPIPWYTYPAIRFLEDRVPSDARVFEFGMGNSTCWWGKRVAQVTTVEHDHSWHDKVARSMPDNVAVTLAPVDSDDYVSAAARSGGTFDILVIDGRRRARCCEKSMANLSGRGDVIWDDFHREHYRSRSGFLRDAGFKELPFWGMTPLVSREALTSIFYRPRNCLGI